MTGYSDNNNLENTIEVLCWALQSQLATQLHNRSMIMLFIALIEN